MIFVPAIILFMVLSVGCRSRQGEKGNDQISADMYSNETLQVIHSRRSVRNFIDRPVSEDDLVTLVRAGMAAPSGKNVRPWYFYIILDRDILNKLADELPTAKMLAGSHAAIVVCGDLTVADTSAYRNYWVMDCSAASENILVAAESMGLGAVWTALFPYNDRMDILRRHISVPATTIPLNIIPVGYPSGIDNPKDKWDPSKLEIIRKN